MEKLDGNYLETMGFFCEFILLRLVFSFLLLPSGRPTPVPIYNIFLQFTLIWKQHELNFLRICAVL